MKKTFKSPAKVNLFLNVIGERKDGYHYIESLMSKISLFDLVSISVSKGDHLKIACPGNEKISNENNLSYKAARAIIDRAAVKAAVDIVIEKMIPIGGGLGGGSSNAAATLKGLNELLGLSLPKTELANMGSALGADVPFFIYDGAALVEGIGEKVTPLNNFPELNLVVLNPGYEISTASIYKMIKGGLTRSVLHDIKTSSFSGIEVILQSINNDLEEFAFKLKPGLSKLKEMLLESGARRALMSGSGSSFFGIFDSKEQACLALETLNRRCSELDAVNKHNVFGVTTEN